MPRGRVRLPDEERRVTLVIRVYPAAKRVIDEEAKKAGVTKSEFMRAIFKYGLAQYQQGKVTIR